MKMTPFLLLLAVCCASAQPPAAQKTLGGCTCDSPCGASLDFGAASCDYCFTKGKCGQYSYSRFKYYDFCSYPVNSTYEGQLWQTKEAALWGNIEATSGKHTTYPNVLGIIDESIQTSFDDQWDVFPTGRKKYIHSVGAVCKFDLNVLPSSPFTGVFQNGTASGLIRMGSAQAVSATSGLTPGLGIKFLRTGVQSANWVMLNSLSAQSSYNFFKPVQSNHIGAPEGVTAILAKKFTQASGCVTQVGLSDAARYAQDGARASDGEINFPYELQLRPKLSFPDAVQTQDEILKSMAAIKVGTELYDVFAHATPADQKAGTAMHLGTVTTTSPCLASTFGDEHLFIRHQRVEEDWVLRPAWMKDIDPKSQCGASSISLDPPQKCEAAKALRGVTAAPKLSTDVEIA